MQKAVLLVAPSAELLRLANQLGLTFTAIRQVPRADLGRAAEADARR